MFVMVDLNTMVATSKGGQTNGRNHHSACT